MSATVSMRMRHLLLAALFNKDSYIGPTTTFVALTTKVALANSSGGALIEPVDGDYVRQEMPLDSDHWQLSGFGEVSNSTEILYPVPGSDWGLLMGWAIADSPEGGDLLASGSLIVPTYLAMGQDPPSLPIGAITIGIYD